MTATEIIAADLDTRIRRTGGVWRVECRALEMHAEGASYAEARDALYAHAKALHDAFAQVESFGLMAANARRLDRLRALLEVLAPAATPAPMPLELVTK